MGHTCPQGLKCAFLKQGKCKYNRREFVYLPLTTRVFDVRGVHVAEMHIAVPNKRPHGKHKANKRSVDRASEAAQSESGFSQ